MHEWCYSCSSYYLGAFFTDESKVERLYNKDIAVRVQYRGVAWMDAWGRWKWPSCTFFVSNEWLAYYPTCSPSMTMHIINKTQAGWFLLVDRAAYSGFHGLLCLSSPAEFGRSRHFSRALTPVLISQLTSTWITYNLTLIHINKHARLWIHGASW